MSASCFPGEFAQLAYVTPALDAAMKLFADRHGVQNFAVIDTKDPAFAGLGLPRVVLALAFKGPLLIELMQPDEAQPGIFALPPQSESVVTLHHVGYFVRDASEWAALPAALERNGHGVVLESPPAAPMPFRFADTRREFGHYSEWLHLTPASEAMVADLPRF